MSKNKAELKICVFSKLCFKNKEKIPHVYPQEICPNTYFLFSFFFLICVPSFPLLPQRSTENNFEHLQS